MKTLAVVLAAALAAAVLYAALQSYSPVFALLLSLAAAAVIALRLGTAFYGVFRAIVQLAQRADGEAFSGLLRCAAILLLADYARAMCEEAGAQSLAWCTSFAGRCLALAAVWPLLEQICSRIWEITG